MTSLTGTPVTLLNGGYKQTAPNRAYPNHASHKFKRRGWASPYTARGFIAAGVSATLQRPQGSVIRRRLVEFKRQAIRIGEEGEAPAGRFIETDGFQDDSCP